MLEGLNNFDILYYINLEHRKDRLEHINNVLLNTNIDKNKINRISGIYNSNLGHLGCAKSHLLVLETFLKTPDNIKNCIILEDDFIFTQSQDIITNLLNEFYNNIQNYDILMLSCNIQRESPTEYPFITKVLDGQTTSGYIVTKNFAPRLIINFKESIQNLENNGKKNIFSIDIYMKRLQPSSNWYCLKPKIGQQIPSFSDIEQRFTSYGC
jgi:GR25 family glycosyltransferase involved in LPS biosynthesis